MNVLLTLHRMPTKIRDRIVQTRIFKFCQSPLIQFWKSLTLRDNSPCAGWLWQRTSNDDTTAARSGWVPRPGGKPSPALPGSEAAAVAEWIRTTGQRPGWLASVGGEWQTPPPDPEEARQNTDTEQCPSKWTNVKWWGLDFFVSRVMLHCELLHQGISGIISNNTNLPTVFHWSTIYL